MISIKNIVKKYGEKIVVDDVSLDFPKNKIVGFIGSNGAGKSTLLSIISRTLSKNGGEVFVDGVEIHKWKNKELSKKLSILKQANNLNVKLTVRELVSFGRYPYCNGYLKEEDKIKVDNAIEYMELKELEDRYLDELSGGQRQMAFIAMVIAQDTEYIFLDEPLNNLDMHHSVQIMKILKRLVLELNKTILVVIHDINFVSSYADYIIAMKDGKIIKKGETNSIITPSVLKQIYNMDIDVQIINDRKVCLYYN